MVLPTLIRWPAYSRRTVALSPAEQARHSYPYPLPDTGITGGCVLVDPRYGPWRAQRVTGFVLDDDPGVALRRYRFPPATSPAARSRLRARRNPTIQPL